MRKNFVVGQTLTVSDGTNVTNVVVSFVRKNTVRVNGGIIGNLRYYRKNGEYRVSPGHTNGHYPKSFTLI